MKAENLSVDQLLAALQRKGIPLAFEIGTFLVLQATEQALVLEATEAGLAAPPVVGIGEVWLSDEGEISVVAARSASSEQEACRALVVLLGDLLVRSAPGVPPMLLELVEHGPSDGQWTLMRLRDDLEASLVPLNRGALRRVLARLLREVRRDVERAPAALAPDARGVDRDLDALFGIESPEPPASQPPSEPPPASSEDARDEHPVPFADQLIEKHEIPALKRRMARSQRPTPKERRRSPIPPKEDTADDLDAEPRPKRAAGPERGHGKGALRLDGGDEADDGFRAFERESAGGGRGAARIGVALAALAAVLLAAFLLLGRERARSMLGFGAAPASGTVEPAAQAPTGANPQRSYGELRIRSTPERAQVLLFVGTGPALATDLPVGVAHEFVAIADDKSPSRAVVAAGVPWQVEGTKPRYELALQLDDAAAKRAADELGATRLPQDVGRPNGTLGDVRVVTSPPGARVYQLVGFTPDVRIENVELGAPIELLVYLEGHVLTTVVVRDGDFKPLDGRRVAQIDVALNRKR